MKSVHKGLRAREITKDTYGRLQCARCEAELSKRSDDGTFGAIWCCETCSREWQQFD